MRQSNSPKNTNLFLINKHCKMDLLAAPTNRLYMEPPAVVSNAPLVVSAVA
jgi:hypothetical protein